VVKLAWPLRLLLGISAVAWGGWMLHLGTIDSQRVVGVSADQSEWVQHLVAAAVLGVLAMLAVGARPVLVFVVLVLAGLLGEMLQLATANRTFSLFDLLADAIGAAVGVGVAVLVGGRRGFAFAALATTAALAVATPWLLEETTPEWARGEEECSDARAPWPQEPQVLLAADLDGTALPTSITDPSAASVVEAVARTDELTLEAWFETSDLDQDGPARVFTFSDGPSQNQVNVHLGVEGDDLSVRLRTACELIRWVQIPDVVAADVPMHVVVTWSAGELVAFVDAVEVSRVEVEWGELDAWDPTFRIRVGDEVGGGRPFVGEVYSVTMWDAALGADEIARRRRLGP